MAELIDNRYWVETPEGVDLQASLAGPAPRALAFIIDTILRTVAYIVGGIIVGILDWAMGLLLIFVFLLEWFYPVFFEVLNNGQTPGKQVVHIAAVNDDLTPVNWNTSLVRNLVRAVDMLPLFYLVGFISCLVTKNSQRIGDITAGTLVIYKSKVAEAAELPDVPAQVPSEPLALDDQLAIIHFTERFKRLSDSRQQELANVLATKYDRKDDEAVQYLHGLGRWLLGDKN